MNSGSGDHIVDGQEQRVGFRVKRKSDHDPVPPDIFCNTILNPVIPASLAQVNTVSANVSQRAAGNPAIFCPGHLNGWRNQARAGCFV